MTLQHWGFTRTPFSKECAVQEYFMSSQFTELTARLQWMVEGRLFGVITGDIGSGKSSAIRYLGAQLDPSHNPVVYLAESHLTPFDFYSQVLDLCGLPVPFQRSQARRQFVTLMTDRYLHQHQSLVIILGTVQNFRSYIPGLQALPTGICASKRQV